MQTQNTAATTPASSPQLDLFTGNLPSRPYAVDRLGDRLLITSARRALRRRYIQANPPWMRVFPLFDIDRPGAALAWEDAALPPPLWTATNRENGHAHSGWCLAAPVLLGQHDRQAPMRYLCAVESCMRERLQADPAYGGLITKNPTNGHWLTLWGPEHSYTLDELAEYLPGLEKHIPKQRPELVGLGRNIDTFDWLRHYAYREIRLWWEQTERRGIYVYWLTHLYQRALEFTHNEHPEPLIHRETHHVAKSVAWWVWTHFSPEQFSEIQAKRGHRGGKASGKVRREAAAERDQAIIEAHTEGLTERALSKRYSLSKTAIHNILTHSN